MIRRPTTLQLARHWLRHFRVRVDFSPTWEGVRWFNVDGPALTIYTPWGAHFLKSWMLFNRRCADGAHYWGFGVLQIGHRHLFGIAFSGASILFVGKIP